MTRGVSGAALVVRFDDVRTLCPRLSRVWTIMERYGVPLHLEVVPAWLDDAAIQAIAERARRSSVPVAVHQHGSAHANHGSEARRFEFDDSRTLDEQIDDIQQGRNVLEAALNEWFEPMFSPPWNRYGASTLEALTRTGFSAFSCLVRPDAPTHPSVAFVPMTMDPVQWRKEPVHRPWDQVQSELAAALEQSGYAGLELHHEVMTDQDMAGFERLLERLGERGVRFPTMRSVAEQTVSP